MDNLPVAMVKTRKNENGEPIKAYERGFHVGFPAQLDVSGARAAGFEELGGGVDVTRVWGRSGCRSDRAEQART